MLEGQHRSIIVGNAHPELLEWAASRRGANGSAAGELHVATGHRARGILEGLVRPAVHLCLAGTVHCAARAHRGRLRWRPLVLPGWAGPRADEGAPHAHVALVRLAPPHHHPQEKFGLK